MFYERPKMFPEHLSNKICCIDQVFIQTEILCIFYFVSSLSLKM